MGRFGGASAAAAARSSNGGDSTDAAGAALGHDFIFNSEGAQPGNRYSNWADLLAAVQTIHDASWGALKTTGIPNGWIRVQFEQDESITPDGMPAEGWDLAGASFHGDYNIGGSPNHSAEMLKLTVEDGVRFRNPGSNWLNNGIMLLSASKSPLVDVAEPMAYYFSNYAFLAAQHAPIFDLSLASGWVQFYLRDDSYLILPTLADIADTDSEVIGISGKPDVMQIIAQSGVVSVGDHTLRSDSNTDLVYIVESAATNLGVGAQQRGLKNPLTIAHGTRADAIGYDNQVSRLSARDVQGAIDELAARVAVIDGSAGPTDPPAAGEGSRPGY